MQCKVKNIVILYVLYYMCDIVCYIVICKLEVVVLCCIVTVPFFFWKFVWNADGDPQWWVDIRQAVSEEDTRHLLETIVDDDEAPKRDDAAPPWPSALRHAIDRERDAELANAVSETEIMIVDFYKTGRLRL